MDDVIALFRQYKDPVYRLALSFTGSPADAEDVTQTVFLKYLETQPELEEGKERAWLLQVTANQCRDLWRRLKYIRQTGNAAPKAVYLLWHHQCRVRLSAGHHGQPPVLAGQNAGRRRKALLGTHQRGYQPDLGGGAGACGERREAASGSRSGDAGEKRTAGSPGVR